MRKKTKQTNQRSSRASTPKPYAVEYTEIVCLFRKMGDVETHDLSLRYSATTASTQACSPRTHPQEQGRVTHAATVQYLSPSVCSTCSRRTHLLPAQNEKIEQDTWCAHWSFKRLSPKLDTPAVDSTNRLTTHQSNRQPRRYCLKERPDATWQQSDNHQQAKQLSGEGGGGAPACASQAVFSTPYKERSSRDTALKRPFRGTSKYHDRVSENPRRRFRVLLANVSELSNLLDWLAQLTWLLQAGKGYCLRCIE